MATTDRLSKLTVDELEAENQALMEERAVVETRVKEEQTAIAHELDLRANRAKLAGALEGMSEEARVALLAEYAEG